jgi:hypothetical protein
MSASSINKKSLGGRPKKFDEASRPVTVTLPERTLRQLGYINKDRAQAIVKAVDAIYASGPASAKQVQVVRVSPENAIILVPYCKTLKRIDFLRLIEVFPTKYLLAIPSGTAVESLEVAVMDLLENLPAENQSEKPVLETLKSLLGHQRRRQKVTKAEILFIGADQASKI